MIAMAESSNILLYFNLNTETEISSFEIVGVILTTSGAVSDDSSVKISISFNG